MPAAEPRQRRNQERRPKHRPAVFAFTCPKPPLGRLHQNDLRKAKDPYSSQAARVSTDHSGASPVASALGIRLGAPPGGRNYTNTHSEIPRLKGDILTLLEKGTFSFCLDSAEKFVDIALPFDLFSALWYF